MATTNDTPAPSAASPTALAGTLLARVIVPLWIIAGGAVKLWERNPQLLPKPVTDVTDWLFVSGMGMSRERYLDPAMRAMVATEFAIGLVMMLGPVRVARWLGASVLGLFCLILGILIASGAAQCGCFGASGPSPTVMIAIDGALLAGLLFLPPAERTSTAATPALSVLRLGAIAVAIGAAIAFLVPQKAAVVLGEVAAAPPAPPAVATRRPWPAMPATAQPWYAPEFETWRGKRLDEQEVMLIIRPLPVNLNEGRHHVVLMREDCDHCHELLLRYFGSTLPAPTISIAVPDASGEPLENPCMQCTKAAFPKGITYVFSTPVLLTVQDGVVVGVCTNSEDAEAVRAAIGAR
ncbi:MAG: MauE/DoxX family redox-associated membrane protein [Phycisphaerales bacterium]